MPGAGERLFLDFALEECVALVGAAVVDGLDVVCGTEQGNPFVVVAEHPALADGQIVDADCRSPFIDWHVGSPLMVAFNLRLQASQEPKIASRVSQERIRLRVV